MSQARIVLTTVVSTDAAVTLARTLVEERLAACVNIVDRIQSIYRWEGSIQQEAEVLLIIKTTAAQCERLRARLDEIHPYEVPEFVAIEPAVVSERYLEWLSAESGGGRSSV